MELIDGITYMNFPFIQLFVVYTKSLKMCQVLRSLVFDIYRFRFCQSNVIRLQLTYSSLNMFLSAASFSDKLKGCSQCLWLMFHLFFLSKHLCMYNVHHVFVSIELLSVFDC